MQGRDWSRSVVILALGGLALVAAGLLLRPTPAPAPPAAEVTGKTPEPAAPPKAEVAATPEPAPPSDPADAKQVLPTRPFQVWAIVVGIDGYPGNIPACAHAGEDASAIAGWFRKTAGWRQDNVLVLNDKGSEIPADPKLAVTKPIRATRDALTWAFDSWLKARLDDDRDGDDVVVFYFAGQAATLPPGDGQVRPSTLLLPIDAALSNPDRPETLQNGWDLAKAIDDLPVPSRNAVVCWLDTSPAGRGKRVGAWALPSDRPAARDYLDGLRRWQGVSAWLASSDGPAADGPGSGTGPGPFVLALAQGLGHDRSPRAVEECLQGVRARLAPRGFVQAGGFPRDLFLWPMPKVVNARSREPVLQRGHLAEVSALAVSPSGELITGGGNHDSVVKVWARDSLRVVQEYNGGHAVGIRGLGVLRAGEVGTPARLLSADARRRLILQNLDPGRPASPRVVPYDGADILDVVVAPSGRLAWVLDQAGAVWSVRPQADGDARVEPVPGRPAQALIAAPARPDADANRWDFALWRKGGDVELLRETGETAGPTIPAKEFGREAAPLLVADPQDGSWLAVTDDRSRTITIRVNDDIKPRSIGLSGVVRAIQAGPQNRLAVAVAGNGLTGQLLLLDALKKTEDPMVVLDPSFRPPAPGRSSRKLAFSPDGRFLAATTDGASVSCWDLTGPSPRPRTYTSTKGESATGLAFLATGHTTALVTLGAGGGLTRWDNLTAEVPRIDRLDARTGRIVGLSASRSMTPAADAPGKVVPKIGPHVLQITAEGRAGLWSLDEKEPTFRNIAGRTGFQSGVAWTRVEKGSEIGYLALVPRRANEIELRRADQPDQVAGRFTVPASVAGKDGRLRLPRGFGELKVSVDGRFLAASGPNDPTSGFWAFVWDVDRPGTPRFVLRPDDLPPGSERTTVDRIDLSPSGDILLTVASGRGKDGKGNAATLWSLDPKAPQADGFARASKLAEVRPSEHRGDDQGVTNGPRVASRITSARLLPDDPRWVAIGTSLGRVELVDSRAPDRRTASSPLRDSVDVLDLAFGGPAGRAFLAAGGDNAEVRFWSVQGDAARKELRPIAAPTVRGQRHAEAVRAVVSAPGATPDQARFLTGGSDTTVRFWTVNERGASLDATAMATPGPGGNAPDDWVAYAPSGLIDGSERGLGQVTLALGDRVESLGDWSDDAREPGLLAALLRDENAGTKPIGPDLSGRAPEIRVEHARPKVGPMPQTTLRISLRRADRDGLAGVRLYHNGTPIDDGLLGRLKAAPAGGRLAVEVPVALRSGKNTFHALAYRNEWKADTLPEPSARRPGLDGSSAPVELVFDGPETPGATHVVAIGVGNYKAEHRRLAYAADDAKAVSAYFDRARSHARDSVHVLTDEHVNTAEVEKAMREVQAATAGHPEDTVVVFLAGHADRVDQRRYALLLSGFPFPAPGQPASRTGPARELTGTPRRNVLEYYRVYAWLSNLSALNRLVVVDACEAERIEDDPGVKAIRRDLSRTSIRARTVNLMAARRGEPANESSELRHGLLTYALLRGLKADGLRATPAGLLDPDRFAHADADRDTFITAEELRDYTAAALPILSASYPNLVQRGNADGSPSRAGTPEPVPDQKLSVSAPAQGGGFAVARLK